MSYNEILDYVQRGVNNEDGDRWNFRKILRHQVIPSKEGNKSVINIQILWKTGVVSHESLEHFAKEIPVELALYTKKKGLLEPDGWKRFKLIENREKHFTRLIKQAKLRPFRTSPRFKYGYEFPKNYADAVRLDKKNKNTK